MIPIRSVYVVGTCVLAFACAAVSLIQVASNHSKSDLAEQRQELAADKAELMEQSAHFIELVGTARAAAERYKEFELVDDVIIQAAIAEYTRVCKARERLKFEMPRIRVVRHGDSQASVIGDLHWAWGRTGSNYCEFEALFSVDLNLPASEIKPELLKLELRWRHGEHWQDALNQTDRPPID